MKDMMSRYEIEGREEWNKYRDTMPATEIRAGYKIQVIPPFGGALMRFRIIAPNRVSYSIYFDANGALGSMDTPYYELYPYYETGADGDDSGDTKRYYTSEFHDILIDIYIMVEGIEAIKKDIPEYFI